MLKPHLQNIITVTNYLLKSWTSFFLFFLLCSRELFSNNACVRETHVLCRTTSHFRHPMSASFCFFQQITLVWWLATDLFQRFRNHQQKNLTVWRQQREESCWFFLPVCMHCSLLFRRRLQPRQVQPRPWCLPLDDDDIEALVVVGTIRKQGLPTQLPQLCTITANISWTTRIGCLTKKYAYGIRSSTSANAPMKIDLGVDVLQSQI